jgi:hypothetical protein
MIKKHYQQKSQAGELLFEVDEFKTLSCTEPMKPHGHASKVS